jgi:GH24 family phage-related lysozyme (muramidase)
MTYAISAAGLALIQRHEGFRAEPAQLPNGAWVVGYSHVRVGAPGEPLSEAHAADLLSVDVAPTERLVNARVTISLSQSQFDALVSFAFSIGAEAFEKSQVLRRVNAGDFIAAACAMDAWRKSDVGGDLEIVDSLVARRAAEKAFFMQDMLQAGASSAFVRPQVDHAAAILGAPVKFAAVPDVSALPALQEKPEPAARLSEILMSEPQTEALLLTQVIPEDDTAESDDEIVTAHARPVARSLDDVREATRRSYHPYDVEEEGPSWLSWFKRDRSAPQTDQRLRKQRRRANGLRMPELDFGDSLENAGLIALLAFGGALIALGGSLFFAGEGSTLELIAGAAVAAPGVAALLMALLSLRRPRHAHG